MPGNFGTSALISILLPAYNAERYISQSINGVLAQTYENFELIVVNDGATDRTREIIAAIRDPRLCILDNPVNLGIVASLNRAQSQARGQYIARIDADDLCFPRRLEIQKRFLDANPGILLVGTEIFEMENGRISPGNMFYDSDPMILRWMSLTGNPIVHSSMMFRTEALASVSGYLREDMRYSEDFDYLHRLLTVGDVSILPEPLVVYRQHDQMLTRIHREEMIAKTAAILRTAYTELLGHDEEFSAKIAAQYLVGRTAVREGALLERIASILESLLSAFIAKYNPDQRQRQQIIGHAAALWWNVLQNSLRAGAARSVALHRRAFRWERAFSPPRTSMARSIASGLLPGKRQVKRLLGKRLALPGTNAPSRSKSTGFELKGVRFETLAFAPNDAPHLHVVVDTESEFDWNRPFDRTLTSVRSTAAQVRAQAIFDEYGLRPIYVVDYAVASQPEGYEPIREIFDRHACAIGAHLHPWVTPPFSETVSEYNSYGGNLPPDLEAAKLRTLVAAIKEAFGVSPLFFKAGRYGMGPSTLETLAGLGFSVDFSIMPGADFRSTGGPDFRFVGTAPCRAIAHDVLSIPMTRAAIGVLRRLPSHVNAALRSGVSRKFWIPGLFARTGLLNVVTLTPEGVTAEEQVRLIRSLANRGHRMFVLHYHSPSLAPGNTPYVRTERDLAELLGRIEKVCSFFFREFGGLPGNPADLVRPALRSKIWPRNN